MSRMRTSIAVSAAAAALMLVSACGGSGSSGSAKGSGSGTGKLDGGGKLIMVFMPSTSNVYLKGDADAIRAEAKKLNYTVKIVENNFDQAQQDQQVQQWLATNEKASAVLWWPASADAGINSSRLLAARAPVIQFNQSIPNAAKPYIKAYVGVSDKGIGDTAGKQALNAVKERQAAKTTFHGVNGKPNLVEFSFPTGYKAADERHNSFTAATADAFSVLTREPVASVDAQGGFKAASQIIPKFKSKGIDFIYAQSNNVAVGVVNALEQNGLVPGKDVIVIAGDYSGDKQPLKDGKIYSSVLQSPVIEGMLAVRTAAQYVATGKVTAGEVTLPADKELPKVQNVAPNAATYMPNPPVTPSTVDSFRIWGMDINRLEP
ncbi:substrate-binding domain-containing protein [Streptomyces sp. NPDC055692]|uniref:sugar ABC transporter substrate-binding protein n=1 Tax=Streptomyces sp. NPDC055692 TaxID=3155683 RepID=UPI003435B307